MHSDVAAAAHLNAEAMPVAVQLLHTTTFQAVAGVLDTFTGSLLQIGADCSVTCSPNSSR